MTGLGNNRLISKELNGLGELEADTVYEMRLSRTIKVKLNVLKKRENLML